MATFPTTIETDDQNEVAILVDGQRFKYWQSAEVNLSMDSIDTFSFSAPFQPEIPKYKTVFQPLSFKPVQVYIGGELVINGTMVTVNPAVTANSRVFSVGGYSLPGVLNDVNFPAEAYPIEFNNFGLQQIASYVAGLFGLGTQFDAPAGALFERIASEPNEKILPFLIKIAHQRNLIVGNTLDGRLLFTQTTKETSVISLKEGELPFLGGAPNYSSQEYFSSITGLAPTTSSKDAENFEAINPFLEDLRPNVFKITDADSADVQTTVNAKIGRMFANAIPVPVTVQGWRVPGGELWKPNLKIKLQSDGMMIYKETEFIIRSVKFTRSTSDQTTLNLVLPEAFSGEIPGTLPWLE